MDTLRIRHRPPVYKHGGFFPPAVIAAIVVVVVVIAVGVIVPICCLFKLRNARTGDDEEFEQVPEQSIRRGLELAVIEALPTVSYQSTGGVETCSVCLEDFEPGIQMTVLPCHHLFHVNCARNALAVVTTCPYCRSNIIHQSVE